MAPPLRPNGALRYDAVRRGLQLANCKPRSILEIGCGVGALAPKLAEIGDYVGLEPDEASYELARARLDGSRAAEIRNVRFEDLDQYERFDLVCAFEVLEHMENDVAELTAWTSRVAPNGLLMVSVPAYQRRFSAYDEYVGHYRRYEPAQLAALLREVGLEDVQVMNWGFPFSYAVEYANLRIVRRQLSKRASGESMHERTAASGRFRTVPDAVGSIATAFVWPFRFAQRRFPTRGPGLLAFGRMKHAS